MAAEGSAPRRTTIQRLLDLRYVGQGYELSVSAAGDFVAAFHRAHERRYGYADPARPVEIVNVRARFIGATAKPDLPRGRFVARDARPAVIGRRSVLWAPVAPTRRGGGSKVPGVLARREKAFFAGPVSRAVPATIYDRAELRPGNRFAGPAVVVEYSATTVLPPGWRARVDAYENLTLEPGRD